MILIIVLSVLLIFLIFIILSPIRIHLDSDKNVYEVYWWGLARMKILFFTEQAIDLKVFFWHKHIPINFSKSKTEKKKKKKRMRKNRFTFRRILNIIKTWKVQDFEVDLDTDDHIVNAYLYPVFSLLSGPRQNMNINYSGEMRFRLIAENSAFRIIRAFIF